MRNTTTEDTPHEGAIGTRIQTLRESRKMAIAALAARAKISTTLMAQIERNQIPPGLVTLANIAKALNVNIDFFFAEEKTIQTIELTRVADRITVREQSPAGTGDAHYDYQPLSCRLEGKKMKTFMARFHDEPASAPEPVTHHGEEFFYCMEGEIDFVMPEKTIRLQPGDSLHFFSQIPHVFRKAGTRTARGIFILLPE